MNGKVTGRRKRKNADFALSEGGKFFARVQGIESHNSIESAGMVYDVGETVSLMYRTNESMRLPWISLTSLALLLVLAPHTMSLPPFDFYATDALSSQRTALIILGLLIAVAAFAEFIFSLGRHREVVKMTIYCAAALACAVLGWRSYPYWAPVFIRFTLVPTHFDSKTQKTSLRWIGLESFGGCRRSFFT
jgi:hypothetical protein